MYCIVVGRNVMIIGQNDGILSYYSCKYGSIEDEDKTPTKEEKPEEAKKDESSK
jgi:hypothetical protein